MKCGVIRDQANNYSVKLLCRMLGVQRSAYYDWRVLPGKVIGTEELALRRRMKALHLKVKPKRKYKVTTDSKHKLPVARNVLNRDFSPAATNQAWGTDITYLWTQDGWIYLAVCY